MKATFAFCLGLLVMAAAPSSAGRNRNGALIVHTNDSVQYSLGADYCGPLFDEPDSCEAAGTRSDRAPGDPAVVWILASFRPEASPGVTVVYFGIEHALGNGGFVQWDLCGPGGSIEIPDDDWPFTGLGNSVAFGSPIVGDTLFPVYWFAVTGDAGSSFGTTANPLGGYAAFVDDGNPPMLDTITNFGLMRWGADGANACSGAVPLGACCMNDGSCLILEVLACEEYGGIFQGEGVPCDPNPCPAPSGGCCFGDGHCEIMTVQDCARFDGYFQGENAACDPNPCTQPPQACCFSWGDCTFVPEDVCRLQGGNPQGPGTTCDQISCRAPQLGACCLQDGPCRVLAESQCLAERGVFYEGVPCDPLPCQTPAERTSWGKIRASFR